MIRITFEGGDGATKPEVFYNADDKLFTAILPTITDFSSTINASSFQAFTLKSESLTVSQIEYELNGVKTTIPYSSSCNFGISSISDKSVTLKITYINEHGAKSLSNTYQFTVNYDPVFNGYTVQGDIASQNGSIVSMPNNKNSNGHGFSSEVSNKTIYNLNNFEISIKFKFYNAFNNLSNGHFLEYGGNSIGFYLGINAIHETSTYWDHQLYIKMSEYPYINLMSNTFAGINSDNWFRFVFTFRKGISVMVEAYNDDTNTLLFSQIFNENRWLGTPPESYLTFGYINTDYICGQYDLSKTWIKDLDTNEILVPWLE